MRTIFINCFFVFSCNLIFAQLSTDVFDLGRKGTVSEVNTALKNNPKAFNVFNEEGYSPLILACYRGNNEVAKILIKNDCEINHVSSMGTALMAASIKGNLELVNALLAKNANPDLTDPNGTTALLYASMFKKNDIARALVKAGAKRDAKDNRGNTALDYAILGNNDEIIQILKS